MWYYLKSQLSELKKSAKDQEFKNKVDRIYKNTVDHQQYVNEIFTVCYCYLYYDYALLVSFSYHDTFFKCIFIIHVSFHLTTG